jgi:hypothetical protein
MARVVKGQPPVPSTHCFTWLLSPSICPPPSVVQGLCGEGDIGQIDFRDKGRREGTQLQLRVQAGAAAIAANRATAATRASKKQGKKRPANERRTERERRRRQAGRRGGGPLQKQEQPMPPAAVEEEQLAEEEQWNQQLK